MPDSFIRLNASPPLPVGRNGKPDRRSVTTTVARLLDDPPGLELTASCTQALETAATVLGVGHGDEVVVPAFSFPSAANAFMLRGASVRFADADLATGNMDPCEVERCLTPRTRAVVAVHYGGVACDLDRLGELTSAGKGPALVEDAAHSLFGSYRGMPLGRHGRLGCLSFHRTKNISSVDGGAIVVNEPDLVEPVRVALDKGTNRAAFEEGRVPAYDWTGLGTAGRLSDGLVGVLAHQLERRDLIQRRRHEVWATYRRELGDWADRLGASLPHVPDGAAHPAHLFWIRLPVHLDRDALVAHCAERGVEVTRHYGSLPHSPFGRRIADPTDRCPNALLLAERLVRLPLHHELDDGDVARVLDAVRSVRAG